MVTRSPSGGDMCGQFEENPLVLRPGVCVTVPRYACHADQYRGAAIDIHISRTTSGVTRQRRGSGPILGAVIGGLTPEQKARVEIDRKLDAAGWVVQDFAEMDLTVAERGIAVREFPTATGRPTTCSTATGRRSGTIEAKKDGEPLLGVETAVGPLRRGLREDREEEGHPGLAPADALPLQSTGKETLLRQPPRPGPRAARGLRLPPSRDPDRDRQDRRDAAAEAARRCRR